MYYYKLENENYVVKYDVNLDVNKLKYLRNIIVEKCSYIKHECYKSSEEINALDYDHIRNYKSKHIGVVDGKDQYLLEYDYYKHPMLVTWIDSLLNGDTSVIKEIENIKEDNISEEQILIDEREKIINDLSKNIAQDISEQIELLKINQEKLLLYKNLNKNQELSSNYKDEVLNYIKFKEVARMPLEDVLKIELFLKDSNDLTQEGSFKKVLKLNKEVKNVL